MKVRSVAIILSAALALASVGCGGGSSSGGSSSTAAAAVGSNQTLTPLSEARASHTAVLLPTGESFVAGGVDVTGKPMTTTVLVSTTAVNW